MLFISYFCVFPKFAQYGSTSYPSPKVAAVRSGYRNAFKKQVCKATQRSALRTRVRNLSLSLVVRLKRSIPLEMTSLNLIIKPHFEHFNTNFNQARNQSN